MTARPIRRGAACTRGHAWTIWTRTRLGQERGLMLSLLQEHGAKSGEPCRFRFEARATRAAGADTATSRTRLTREATTRAIDPTRARRLLPCWSARRMQAPRRFMCTDAARMSARVHCRRTARRPSESLRRAAGQGRRMLWHTSWAATVRRAGRETMSGAARAHLEATRSRRREDELATAGREAGRFLPVNTPFPLCFAFHLTICTFSH